jgi:hypothetical protein
MKKEVMHRLMTALRDKEFSIDEIHNLFHDIIAYRDELYKDEEDIHDMEQHIRKLENYKIRLIECDMSGMGLWPDFEFE